MMNKKTIIILLVLVVVFVGALVVYQQSYKHWPWQNVAESPIVTGSPEASGTPRVKTQRDRIMEDVAQKIAELSPEQPTSGKNWAVDRFWFVSGSDLDFYVEYEDGHLLDRILLKAQPESSGFSYKVVAFFTAGESDWILQSGTDEQFGKGLDLYEYDSGSKIWVKKN